MTNFISHVVLDGLSAGAYACDQAGRITYFSARAVELWGRAPALNDDADLYCGSWRLFTPAGEPVPHKACWMARSLQTGFGFNNREIVVERPDGTRVLALAHANVVRGRAGEILGGVNVMVDATTADGPGAVIAELLAALTADAPRTLTPVCSWCKKVRHAGEWRPLESYVTAVTGAGVTHGICPGCLAAQLAAADSR